MAVGFGGDCSHASAGSTPPPPPTNGRAIRTIRRLLTLATALYAVTWAVNRSLRDVEGPSMLPTLWPGDRLLTIPTALRAPRTGDVVVTPDPRRRARSTVKRIAALPGQTVEIDGVAIRAGAGQVVLLGDNPASSTDSRVFGPVPLTDVRAVVVATVDPLRRVR